MVTQTDIENSLKEIGLKAGDTVLFHSSLKSFGQVDGGADAVISAFLNIVTSEGTVIVPTLSQKDFDNSYRTWHMDKPSDVGIITEVFRKMPEALRSDQATHSVAAIGKLAEYYTCTHGKSGLRNGPYGDTPFSGDSPWQKMHDNNIKVVFIGVGFESYTLKHLIEYTLAENALNVAASRGEYEKCAKELLSFDTRCEREKYIWPSLSSEKMLETGLKYSLISSAICGNSELMAFCAKDLDDAVMTELYKNLDYWFSAEWHVKTLAWMKENTKN